MHVVASPRGRTSTSTSTSTSLGVRLVLLSKQLALHILCLCASEKGNSTEGWMKMMKVDRATAEALKARQRGDVIESVRVMLEAGADPTLQTSRQAKMTTLR